VAENSNAGKVSARLESSSNSRWVLDLSSAFDASLWQSEMSGRERGRSWTEGKKVRVGSLGGRSVRSYLSSLYITAFNTIMVPTLDVHFDSFHAADKLDTSVPSCLTCVKLTDARLRGSSQEPHLPGVVLRRNALRNKHRLQSTTRTEVEERTIYFERD